MTAESAQRPEDLRDLPGLILVSEQPERLVDFYRDVLGLPLAEERHGETAPHWACELGDVHFAIHPVADYEGEPTATGAVKLAFMTFDLAKLIQWLQTRGSLSATRGPNSAPSHESPRYATQTEI